MAAKYENEEWQATFDCINDGIFLLAPDQKILRSNRYMKDLLGKSGEELVGRYCYEVVHKTGCPIDGCPVEKMKHSLRRETMDLQIGSRWFNVTADPLLDDKNGLKGILHIIRDITENRGVKDVLHKSEERYKTLAEASPEMIYLISPDGIIQYVNNTAAKMFHAPASAVIGKHLSDLYPPEIAARHLQAISGVIISGRSYATEVRETFPGKTCWIDVKLTPVKDDNGVITAVLGLSQDISERKHMEKELRESEERFRRIFDQGPIGIALSRTDKSFLKVNPALCAMFGYTEEEFAGLTFKDITHPDSLDDTLKSGERLDSGEIPFFQLEKKYRAKGGQTLWGELILSALRDDDGKILYYLVIIKDITERKRIEKELRESEARFRRIFDQSPIAIAMAGKDFRFFCANPAFCKMFGYSEQEVPNLTFKDISHPDYLGEGSDNIARIIKGDQNSYQTEKQYIAKGGQMLWGSLQLSVLRDDEGKFIHILAMIKDITNQKKMEQELLKTQKLEALGVLAGGIAHDFNNMLAGVFGFMDLARQSLDPAAPAAEYLRNAFLAFERAKALSRQLLTFAKGGAPVKRPVRIEGLLKECCNLSMSGSNVNCVYAIESDLDFMEADEHQLSQVFSNILINARQAMPDGGTVAVYAENRRLKGNSGIPLPDGNYVVVGIRDEGIGIPDKIISRIFDPFFSTKQQGSGLGLATSYSIVKRHGGHIEASSHPGEGTTITVLLPASAKTETPLPVAEKTENSPMKDSGRILVMDDEKSIRELTIAVLKTAGYEVIAVPDGTAAIEQYRIARGEGKPFSLVILDLTVPGGIGGDRAIIELQKIDPDIVAVVSSGYADNEILSNPGAHGFAGKIAKPYRTDELLRTVKKVLKKL